MNRTRPGQVPHSAGSRGDQSQSSGGASRMRIRQLPAKLNTENVQKIWEKLREAIQKIQHKNNSELSFEELYRNAYTMVLHKHGALLYDGTIKVIEEHLRVSVRPAIISQIHNGQTLDALLRSWEDHTTSMTMIKDILMYMDRVHVKQNKLDNVKVLGIKLFRQQIIDYVQIKNRVRELLLERVETDRKGDRAAECTSVKDVCAMLMDLGCKSNAIYVDVFEKAFLAESEKFYANEAETLLATSNATDYLKKVHDRLHEEEKRTKTFLDPSSAEGIKNVIVDRMLTRHAATIVNMEGSGAISLIESDRLVDLERMHKLLKLTGDVGIVPLQEAISKKLCDQGLALRNKFTQPINYIQNLILLKKQYDKIIRTSFSDQFNIFTRLQTDEFEKFMNIPEAKTPEFLSLFIDSKLRKGSKSTSVRIGDSNILENDDDDIEVCLDECVVLFRLLQEKDVFERYYKQHLCKRMLMDKISSDDIEQSMISKLKIECGSGFTTKLEAMYKDQQLYRALNDKYKQTRTNRIDAKTDVNIDISVKVLTAGMWPLSYVKKGTSDSSIMKTQDDDLSYIPPNMQKAFEHYKRFYLGEHQGRKLTLLPFYGSGEMRFTPQVTKRKYTLIVTTSIMFVLSKFNEKSEWTYEELRNSISAEAKVVNQALVALSSNPKQRVLLRKSKDGEPDLKMFSSTDTFQVNDKFESKTVRIKIIHGQMMRLKGEDASSLKETKNKVDDDRRIEIEATIVRLMKARQTLTHAQLITEVIEQLSKRFKPQPHHIKQKIETLIDREYLQRSAADREIYEYVA